MFGLCEQTLECGIEFLCSNFKIESTSSGNIVLSFLKAATVFSKSVDIS